MRLYMIGIEDIEDFTLGRTRYVAAESFREAVDFCAGDGLTSIADLGELALTGEKDVQRPTQQDIEDSVQSDHIISFEDNKAYKALKRHLTGRGITPAQYRAKWGLPADYPMVAPEYSKRRSGMAKASGLGRR